MTDPRPQLLSRSRRIAGTDWTKAASWLGGTPRLGSLSWPRSDETKVRTPFDLDELRTVSLLAMLTGDDAAYQTIPEPVRDGINEQFLLPTNSWHQMFGRGVDIQGNAAYENEGKIMLLQLVYDDMINWRFGDVGAYQFWISHEDLGAGNWSGVSTTFEGH